MKLEQKDVPPELGYTEGGEWYECGRVALGIIVFALGQSRLRFSFKDYGWDIMGPEL